ncbi:hypothetical protein KUTeg_000235 [Tegillarca granosa]|uniref:TIR domain-containing protein n=1 Tax=Tegillarca granosa TaxID=220873 RepID=A0ABQ9FX31_TEGGR|nr:hypothetical protein KUTeg_000235 [Tegillarca granosa]
MRQIARNDTNKKALLAFGAVPMLVELAQSFDEKEQRGDHKKEEKGQTDAISKEKESCDKGHVMISYHSANRNTLLKVKERMINDGFKVWMDVDNMEGSIIDSMATAVEDADIVLLCFSRGYKGSANCRAEAEYAYRKKKQIIPLRMESKYEPDGWLGFIVGSKKYYDFGGKRSFETEMDCLFKELRRVYFDEKPLKKTLSEKIHAVRKR